MFDGISEWRRLLPMLIETAALSGTILIIIGTATGMAWSLTQSGFSAKLASAMTGLPGGSASFLAISVIASTPSVRPLLECRQLTVNGLWSDSGMSL